MRADKHLLLLLDLVLLCLAFIRGCRRGIRSRSGPKKPGHEAQLEQADRGVGVGAQVYDDEVGARLAVELPLRLLAKRGAGRVVAPAGVPVVPERVVEGDGLLGQGGAQGVAPVTSIVAGGGTG